jgi:hypothetical protein
MVAWYTQELQLATAYPGTSRSGLMSTAHKTGGGMALRGLYPTARRDKSTETAFQTRKNQPLWPNTALQAGCSLLVHGLQ